MGIFLQKLFEQADPNNSTLLSQPEISETATVSHGPVKPGSFTLHSMLGFSHMSQIQLLFNIFLKIPHPFQFLCCTKHTTFETISLFMEYVSCYRQHKYVVFDVNCLTGAVQSVRILYLL